MVYRKFIAKLEKIKYSFFTKDHRKTHTNFLGKITWIVFLCVAFFLYSCNPPNSSSPGPQKTELETAINLENSIDNLETAINKEIAAKRAYVEAGGKKILSTATALRLLRRVVLMSKQESKLERLFTAWKVAKKEVEEAYKSVENVIEKLQHTGKPAVAYAVKNNLTNIKKIINEVREANNATEIDQIKEKN